jgi:class 3 adenylate cyclase
MYIDALVQRLYGWTDAEFNREMVAFCHQSATQASAQALFRAMAEIDLASAIAAVDAPTLVLHAEGAGFSSIETSRGLAAGLRNGRLATFDASAGFDMVGGLPFVERFLDEEDGRSSAVPAPLESAAAHPSGGTRTILFTDIVGHTEMMQRLGDAKGRDVLREHERITRELLNEFGGAEVKTMGDGFMASFGSVTKAMDCAIALQRAFAAHEGEPLHVRVGLNAGEPIEEDGDLFGSTVIMASRIAAKASAGQILIPEPLRHLLSGKSYVYADRGETMLKGFEDAVRLYEVRWQE